MRIKKGFILGIGCLSAAILIVVGKLGLLGGVGPWSIVFSIVFGLLFIEGALRLSPTRTLFPLAFLCIIWDTQLGIESLTPWPVLCTALLGSIGLNLLFGKEIARFKAKCWINKHSNIENTMHGTFINFNPAFSTEGSAGINTDVSDVVKFDNVFSKSVKYVNSKNLQNVVFDNVFGSSTVYLDQAVVPSKELHVNCDNVFGSVDIFMPKDWVLAPNVDGVFGGVSEKGRSTGIGEVTVFIHGSAVFGSITVHYI